MGRELSMFAIYGQALSIAIHLYSICTRGSSKYYQKNKDILFIIWEDIFFQIFTCRNYYYQYFIKCLIFKGQRKSCKNFYLNKVNFGIKPLILDLDGLKPFN